MKENARKRHEAKAIQLHVKETTTDEQISSAKEDEEFKLSFICGKALAQAENLALQSGLPLKLVTARLREFFQRA